MCGIGGIIQKGESYKDLVADLTRMATVLHHRGPDDEGFFFMHADYSSVHCFGSKTTSESIDSYDLKPISDTVNPVLGLLHKRLSILDTSCLGHQPMIGSDNKYVVIHNGEIYNFLELRNELQHKGFTFKSNTDTEVLLAAYQVWGKAMLSKLNGMWAFAIYDTINKIIFFARDRFGVKPLYYLNTKKAFAFASEIKGLTESSIIQSNRVNQKSVSDYFFKTKYEPIGETFFEGIQELKAGHYMEYQLNTHELNISQYYKLETTERWENPNAEAFQKYVKGIQEKLIDSINLRLRSDVTIGACLSGGIDSSVIVSYIQQKQEIQTFTSSFKDEGGEQFFAKEVMKGHEENWHQSFPSAEGFKNQLEELVYTQDQPFYNTSTFAQYELMKLVKSKGIKVTLDGQGADELLAGYSRSYYEFIREAYAKGAYSKVANLLFSTGNKFADKKGFLKDTIKRNINLQKWHPYYEYYNEEFFNNQSLGYEDVNTRPSLNRHLVEEFSGDVLKGIFRTADRNSMQFSVENRMPFADDVALIEYAFSIPSVYKVRGTTNKVLLREAFKHILPAKIYNRKDKVGFYTPEQHWIKQLDNELFEYLTPELEGYINVGALRKDWKKILGNPSMNSGWVWRALNFAIWKKVYSL